MNLNKTHKARIVRDIMADIPVIDYSAQAQALLQAKAVEKMPAEIKAIYDNPELRRWLPTRWVQFANHLSSSYIVWQREGREAVGGTLYAYRIHYNSAVEDQELVTEVQGPLADLSRAAEAQWKARWSMEEKLEAMLRGIRTLRQAKTLLEPELHKYLPEEPPKDNKPAQASTALVPYVVAGLREMGWPKKETQLAQK
jgi:hypothetical protein